LSTRGLLGRPRLVAGSCSAAGPPRLRWAGLPRALLGCPLPARLWAELCRAACFCLNVLGYFVKSMLFKN